MYVCMCVCMYVCVYVGSVGFVPSASLAQSIAGVLRTSAVRCRKDGVRHQGGLIMYVCMNICMYVCIYVYMYKCTQ